MCPLRMARVNVYLPDDLADEVRLSGLNVSAVGHEAFAPPWPPGAPTPG